MVLMQLYPLPVAANARTVAVQEYHYHDREVMAVTCPKDTYGSLKKSLVFHTYKVMAYQSVGSLSIEMYSITFYSVIKEHRLISLSKHTGNSML